ncbi:MAG TPA: zf-TFIIB domain-containing protein, partial [Planctomycetota bacterium]|nr:zf-TFIIB domain-containing protein [Planctomycetota bacterium]
MNCPTCSLALVPLPFRGLELDACPRGEWIWIRRGFLARLYESIEPKFTREDLVSLRKECREREGAGAAAASQPLPCPGCGKPLDRRRLSRVSGIPAHSCKEHGFLVTRRGFEQFVDFLARGGEIVARERLAPKLAKIRAEAEAEAARQVGWTPSVFSIL